MVWLLLVAVILITALVHELSHVLVARRFGYRPLAWGPVVGGAFIIFDDTFEPDWPRFYWPMQLAVPWLATAALLPLAWLVGFRAAGVDWVDAAWIAISPTFLVLSLLVSASASLGDLILVLAMPRVATHEADLTLWDMRLHQSFGAWPIFTRYGQEALLRRYGEPARLVWKQARRLPRPSLRRWLR